MREKILQNGWRQGSYILFDNIKVASDKPDAEIMPFFIPNSTDRKKLSNAIAVAINTSCDVVRGEKGSLPHVKFAIGYPNPNRNNVSTNVDNTNPRKFYLTVNETTYLFEMKWRCFIPSSVLSEIKPDNQLSEEMTRKLIQWKVSQFNRLAIPESLARRIGPTFSGPDFKNFLTEHRNEIEGLYLKISTRDELDDTTPYELGCVLVLQAVGGRLPSHIINKHNEMMDNFILTPLRHTLGIKLLNDSDIFGGLSITDSVMLSSDFTLDHLKDFRRYYLDNYSLDAEAESSSAGND